MKTSRIQMLLAVLLAIPAFSAIVAAADKSTATAVVPAGFTALVDGHDLAGWQEAVKAAEHWKVENGELLNDGKGTDLITAKSYRNFELMLEWKIPLKGDSGVYLPGGQQVQIWAKVSGSGGFVFNHKYERC